jgi:hypothetical protein
VIILTAKNRGRHIIVWRRSARGGSKRSHQTIADFVKAIVAGKSVDPPFEDGLHISACWTPLPAGRGHDPGRNLTSTDRIVFLHDVVDDGEEQFGFERLG